MKYATFNEWFFANYKRLDLEFNKKLGTRVAGFYRKAEEGWEPMTYDKYDEDTGWSYKECEPEDAFFVRCVKTGKMYRANQHKRQWRHRYKNPID